jgi:hypothetical protein
MKYKEFFFVFIFFFVEIFENLKRIKTESNYCRMCFQILKHQYQFPTWGFVGGGETVLVSSAGFSILGYEIF